MKRIAVTGATGFIGRALVADWSECADIVPLVRNESSGMARAVQIGQVGPETDWASALAGVDVVIHCAGRAHILKERARNALQTFREINSSATRKLAQDAVAAGVKRLVFLSSVGVMGQPKDSEGLLRLTDTPAPEKAYAVSKWEAELALRKIESVSDLEVVVVRPPLVYGKGAPANFFRLVTAIKRGVPLPFGKVDALRSFVGIDNLSDFLWLCATSPKAPGGTFFVSDGEDLSTSEFSRRIATQLGVPSRLLPIPPVILRMAGLVAGKTADIDRLLSNLRVDIGENDSRLGWRPKHSVNSQLKRAFSD